MKHVLVLAMLFIVVVGWLCQPRMVRPALELAAPAPGIPLTSFDLPLAAPPITAGAEAEVVVAWWRRQPMELVEAANALLNNRSTASGWTDLHVCSRAAGGLVVLFTDHAGLVGTCEFDAHGDLLACDHQRVERLPLVIPQAAGTAQRVAPVAAQDLAVHLLRLRDYQPSMWLLEALDESADPEWEWVGGFWDRAITKRFPAGNGSSTWTLRLDANGTVQESVMYSVRGCGCGASSKRRKSATPGPEEAEPPLPVANN